MGLLVISGAKRNLSLLPENVSGSDKDRQVLTCSPLLHKTVTMARLYRNGHSHAGAPALLTLTYVGATPYYNRRSALSYSLAHSRILPTQDTSKRTLLRDRCGISPIFITFPSFVSSRTRKEQKQKHIPTGMNTDRERTIRFTKQLEVR